jgi:hypothetical protein
VAIIGPKSRKLASRLVKVCGVDHASAMPSQIEEAEDPRAYVAVTIKNAQLRADGRSGSGKPRPPDFAAVMDRICEAEFDSGNATRKADGGQLSTRRTAERKPFTPRGTRLPSRRPCPKSLKKTRR